jgi:tetratricopeptide (TPR) repeat protein
MRALVILVCLGLASPALAQPKKSTRAQKMKAKALYEEGLRFYNIGEYDRAVEKFKESYVVVAAPLLLFNIAQAQRLGGDCEAALRSYETYLREVPKPGNKQQVDQAVTICEKKVAAAKPAEKPAEKPVQPEQPAPVEVAEAEAEAELEPEADVEADADTPSRPGRTKKIIGIAVGATGIALAATGAYFGLQASSQASDIEEFDGVWDDTWEDKEAAQRRNRVLAPVLIGTGIAAIAGGVVLFILGDREATDAELAIAPTDGGAAFFVSGAF